VVAADTTMGKGKSNGDSEKEIKLPFLMKSCVLKIAQAQKSHVNTLLLVPAAVTRV